VEDSKEGIVLAEADLGEDQGSEKEVVEISEDLKCMMLFVVSVVNNVRFHLDLLEVNPYFVVNALDKMVEEVEIILEAEIIVNK
jgi:hypothetical protein